MMAKRRFWIKGGVIKMANGKLELTALGAYLVGFYLERLEWAIAVAPNTAQIAPHIGALRGCEQICSFEDIGREAKYLHDTVSGYGDQEVSQRTKNDLRDARARWDTLARERLQDLYLVTPKSKIYPKYLMQGIEGFLSPECFSMLEGIELIDLREACYCILIGSATAAEHIALRAAESLLRRWYEHKTHKKISYRTWGTVLKRLAREYPEGKKRPKEIALLGYLKQRRDEVAHPQRVSSLTEAEATLMNVCSLIEGLAPVLAKLVSLPELDIKPPVAELEAPNSEKEAIKEKKEANSGEPEAGK